MVSVAVATGVHPKGWATVCTLAIHYISAFICTLDWDKDSIQCAVQGLNE